MDPLKNQLRNPAPRKNAGIFY